MRATMTMFSDRARLARLVFALGAGLGLLGIGAAALYGAAYASDPPLLAFASILLPLGAGWLGFCYGAYRGLGSARLPLNILFWLFVALHAFAFPVGTLIAGLCIWLWGDRRAAAPGSSAAP